MTSDEDKDRAAPDPRFTQLLGQNSLYRQLFNEAPYAQIVMDVDGQIRMANRKAEALFGIPAKSLRGKDFQSLVRQQGPTRIEDEPEQYFAQALIGIDEDERIYLCRDSSGQEIQIDISLSPVNAPDGMLLVADIRDGRHRSRTSGKFRALLESAPDAMVMINQAGHIVLVNAQAENMFDYSRSELLGKPVETLIPEHLRDRHANHRSSFFSAPVVRGMGAGLQLSGQRKEGQEFPIEISLSPLETVEGLWATAAVRDITERKVAEKRFRSLLETAPDAMIIINRVGRIVLVNDQAERVFGYSRGEMLDNPVEMLIPERLRDRHASHRSGYFEAPIVRGMGAGLELWGLRKDRHEFPIEISLSPLETEDGIWATAAVRDITERKLVESKLARSAEDLARSNRDLEQFAYVASHDLQAPLRSVIGFSQLLAKKYQNKLDEEGREFLDFVEKSGKHMQLLINGLLEFSRVGNEGTKFSAVDSNAVMDRVREQLHSVIQERGAVITNDKLPTIHASEMEFNQVLQNLISNGLKFQPGDGPRVHVSAERKVDGWHFGVRDWGIGIQEEHKDRIFQIFQRLHQPEEFSGTGIGLAVCLKIIHRHGGRIWVDSIPGEGTTFNFTIRHAD